MLRARFTAEGRQVEEACVDLRIERLDLRGQPEAQHDRAEPDPSFAAHVEKLQAARAGALAQRVRTYWLERLNDLAPHPTCRWRRARRRSSIPASRPASRPDGPCRRRRADPVVRETRQLRPSPDGTYRFPRAIEFGGPM